MRGLAPWKSTSTTHWGLHSSPESFLLNTCQLVSVLIVSQNSHVQAAPTVKNTRGSDTLQAGHAGESEASAGSSPWGCAHSKPSPMAPTAPRGRGDDAAQGSWTGTKRVLVSDRGGVQRPLAELWWVYHLKMARNEIREVRGRKMEIKNIRDVRLWT